MLLELPSLSRILLFAQSRRVLDPTTDYGPSRKEQRSGYAMIQMIHVQIDRCTGFSLAVGGTAERLTCLR